MYSLSLVKDTTPVPCQFLSHYSPLLGDILSETICQCLNPSLCCPVPSLHLPQFNISTVNYLVTLMTLRKGYWVKDTENPSHGVRLLHAVKHIKYYNLRMKIVIEIYSKSILQTFAVSVLVLDLVLIDRQVNMVLTHQF